MFFYRGFILLLQQEKEKNIIVSSAERKNFSLMNMRQIETFLETTRHRSFSEAANALYISTPALNQQISLLEESIGLSLVERTPRGSRLTKAGESFRETASILLSVYHDGVAKGKQIANIREETLRLAIPIEDTPPYLVDLTSKFRAEHNSVELSFLPFPAIEEKDACRSGKVDLYFSPDLEMADDDLLFIPLYQDDMYVVMSADDPLSAYESLTLDDLVGKTLYVEDQYEYGPFAFRPKIEAAHLAITLDNTPYSTAMLVNISLGKGMMPIPYRWLSNYGPMIKAVRLVGFRRTYGFTCRKEHSHSVDLFADFAKAYFNE